MLISPKTGLRMLLPLILISNLVQADNDRIIFLPKGDPHPGNGEAKGLDEEFTKWEDDPDKKKDHGKNRHTTGLYQIQPLAFEPGVVGMAETQVTDPDSENAAIFEAMGYPGELAGFSVVEEEIALTERSGKGGGLGPAHKGITVDRFKTGGSIDKHGKGFFDRRGYLSNIRVGATIHPRDDSAPGDYRGSATLRMVYL